MVLGTTACNINRPCDEPTQFPILSGFYDSIGADTTLAGLTIFGIGREDSLLADMDTLHSVSLPLNPFTDTSRFVMTFGPVADTLSFMYQRNLRMVNPECGFAMYFQIETINHTHNFIDSLILLDQYLDANAQEHLQIFVH